MSELMDKFNEYYKKCYPGIIEALYKPKPFKTNLHKESGQKVEIRKMVR